MNLDEIRNLNGFNRNSDEEDMAFGRLNSHKTIIRVYGIFPEYSIPKILEIG